MSEAQGLARSAARSPEPGDSNPPDLGRNRTNPSLPSSNAPLQHLTDQRPPLPRMVPPGTRTLPRPEPLGFPRKDRSSEKSHLTFQRFILIFVQLYFTTQ